MSVILSIYIRNLFVITLSAQQGISLMTLVLPPTTSHFTSYLFILSCATGNHAWSHRPTPSALLRPRHPIRLCHSFALQISPNAASGCPMSLSMTGGSLTSPGTTRTCSTMLMEDQSFVNSSTHHHCLMRWIYFLLCLQQVNPWWVALKRSQLVASWAPGMWSSLCHRPEILVRLQQQRHFYLRQELQMCHWYWGCTAYCRQENHLWAKGNTHHAGCHCCPGKSRPHTADPWWTLALQGSSCS